MLWKKKSKPIHGAAAPAPSSSEALAEAGDRALDVLTSLLKLYGKYAFDTDAAEAADTEAQCSACATRINLGTPRAEVASGSANDSEPPANAAKRDWPGLLGFMQDQRRSESEYVIRSMTNFREAILC